MTPEQIATNRYLVEYKDANGLLLPQYGGECKATRELVDDSRVYVEYPPPDLYTPNGFIALWEAMQAREDWEDFLNYLQDQQITVSRGMNFTHRHWFEIYIDPLTFPETVTAYLKEREGK